MKARSLISVAAAIFATTCAYGRFVYTETGNLSGSLSDGIWVLNATRVNDTTWSHTYGVDTKNWSIISGKMAADSAMCTKSGNTITVHDKNIIAFVMRGNNTGCWVLKEPKRGLTVVVR